MATTSESAFPLFGPAHLAIIGLTILLPLALGLIVRKSASCKADRILSSCLAFLLLVNYFGFALYLHQRGLLHWKQALPFQLCDWAMITVAIALFSQRRLWMELSYFWGIGGTLQAIVTPDLQVGFSDFRAISFFIAHCGIVVGVIYLILARHFRPTLRSVGRTLLCSQLYLVSVLLVDHLTGVNYGFLLHKPVVHSLLDYLSTTRWLYLLELEGLAVLFFLLLYLPWAIGNFLSEKK